jgi:hypothetical protein
MAKVAPWHSAKPGARPVYHDNDRGTENDNIEAYYWRPGTGNRRLCEHCDRLDKEARLASRARHDPLSSSLLKRNRSSGGLRGHASRGDCDQRIRCRHDRVRPIC